jgi:cation transporter-like permease
LFVVLAFVALLIDGLFSPATFYNNILVLILVLLATNVVAVTLIVFISFAIAIITFQKGLDPGNFVIPIENAFAASITTFALLFVLTLLSLGSVI